jgi:hypothetical protein
MCSEIENNNCETESSILFKVNAQTLDEEILREDSKHPSVKTWSNLIMSQSIAGNWINRTMSCTHVASICEVMLGQIVM